jgi:hypothetical protein
MFEKKKIIPTPYAIEQCKSCKKEIKRKFKEGDILFLETSQCKFCDGKLQIEQIFGETIEE